MELFAALQLVVYLVSWLSVGLCFYNGNPGPYFFITTVETHISVQAPLGQCIPILDVTTNFFHVHAWFLSPAFMVLFVIRVFSWSDMCFRCGSNVATMGAGDIVHELLTYDTWWWAGCSLLLAIRAHKSRHLSSDLKQSFLGIRDYPEHWFDDASSSSSSRGGGSLLRLPWYVRLHPFLLHCTARRPPRSPPWCCHHPRG
jgi:hypothetical protein